MHEPDLHRIDLLPACLPDVLLPDRSLSGKVDGLLMAEEIMAAGDLHNLAKRIPVVVIAGRRDEAELDVVVADNLTAVIRTSCGCRATHGDH